ncbi:MAG: phosphoribosylamine--glycine ligase [Alphaproteobacteria bacterium]|nr:phosphoribosylamine--glycine ligase [Alphaproteobacteria bacterium]
MKTLVIGSGGREHAMCWAIAKSPLLSKLYCAPGNAGIADIAECLPIPVDKIADILSACRHHQIDFVVIGPEIPLALGLADELRATGIACFGPSKAAAEIESSKGFMKDLVARAGVPTAVYKRFHHSESAKAYVRKQGAPIVVKADGLAAGKGVTVAHTIEEACAAIDEAMVQKAFGDSGAALVIEEFMEGEEASFFALCDGETVLPFAAAQDHKAVFDGDKGPNTGGMGAYSPAPIVDAAMQERIMREIIHPTVKAMREAGRPFTGVLFAGLMITKAGPRLIEFNARFGDPETQAMLLRLKSDLLALLYAAAKGMLDGIEIHWHDRAALCVVMAAEGYPGTYKKNTIIRGLDEAAALTDTVVFHAGTARDDAGNIIAIGGRVLNVCGWGLTITEAQARAYEAVDKITWPEGFCRRDIGWRAIEKTKAA